MDKGSRILNLSEIDWEIIVEAELTGDLVEVVDIFGSC